MKKFLKKKPVMITFCVLAALMLIFYIGMMVRPVAIGMSYKTERDGVEVSLKFNSTKKLTMTMSEDGEEESIKYYYIAKGREIAIIMTPASLVSDKAYEELKEQAKEDWGSVGMVIEDINAFKMEIAGEDYVSTGSIVFAVVCGVITVTLLVFAGMSVAAQSKKRK